MLVSVQSRSEMVQAESVSIEENFVVTGSVCQYRTGTAYVDCGSVDSTGISIYLYKAEVRWYRLSLSVVRRTELEQVVYVSV